MKKPEGKYKPSLVYRSSIEAMARVRAYGIKKHGSMEGWKTTTTIEHLDAAARHLLEAIDAINSGDLSRLTDAESGEPHLAMTMTNLMFEIERGHVYAGEIKEEPECAS